jgi:uncharacterized phage protein gp47/JayE
MASFGVLPSGFAKKLQSDIEDEIKADQLGEISPSLNQLPTSVIGQWNGIFSDKLRELWDLAEAVYRSQYPDSADDEALDQIASITGAFRLTPLSSTVELEVNIDAGVTLLTGRLVSDPNTGVQFETTEDVTNPGPGAADLPVASQSVETGPIAAVSGTLLQIDTPVAGWNTVTNPLDADPGRDRETNDAFRLRREQLLRISGAATKDAIRAAVLNILGVTQVIVFENDSDVTDGAGLPPHSFEVVVDGGASAEIAQTIFDTKAAGIQTFGTSSDTAVDSQGISDTVFYSRPTRIDIYVDVTVTIDSGLYPIDGDDQIKAAIVAAGDALEVGEDVIYNKFLCVPFEIAGVVDVTAMIIDITTIPPGTGTANIAILPRELALFDTSRIAVTTV